MRNAGRVGVFFLALGVALLAVLSPARAWEFNMAAFDHTAQSITLFQNGDQGFFGKYNIDNQGTFPSAAANRNFWWGYTLASGSQVKFGFHHLSLLPEIKINPAVSIKGDLWIGPHFTSSTLANLVETSWYPMAIGIFSTGWLEVNLPWGKLSYGKKPFAQGLGLMFGGTSRWADTLWYGRTETYVDLDVPYGPLMFRLGISPPGGDWGGDLNSVIGALPALPLLADSFDRATATRYNGWASVTYRNANLEAGVGAVLQAYEWGPERVPTAFLRAAMPGVDVTGSEGWLYLKYFNGRFFFNAEADWYYKTVRFAGSLNGTFLFLPPVPQPGAGSLFAPRYLEHWRYMTEFGFVCGPAKLSFLYTNIPGGDRRHGVLTTKQTAPIVGSLEQSAGAVFRPYAQILPLAYHGGIASGFLDVGDAQCFGARLDYAVASNLNVGISGLKAKRLSKVHGMGYWFVDPTGITSLAFPNPQTLGNFNSPVPAVPDDNLGEELDIDVRWQLLENWMFKFTGGYFWPGKWWSGACIDRSIPNWETAIVAPAYPYAVNPARSIDPVGLLRFELWTFF